MILQSKNLILERIGNCITLFLEITIAGGKIVSACFSKID